MTQRQQELLRWLYATGQIEERVRPGGPVRRVLCRRYQDSVYPEGVRKDILAIAKEQSFEVDAW